MSERFFVTTPIVGEQATLAGDEARHLVSVMRAGIGDEITLFDASGAEFTGRISTIRKQDVDLAIVERREISRELPLQVTLAVALPKGDRQKWLIEKATELGITRLVPLVTERGVAQAVESALDRLRRNVIEASKQCGRNVLLEIAPPAAAGEFFVTVPPAAMRIIADPGGGPIAKLAATTPPQIIAAIGPEGGFTEDEIAAARSAGWHAVSLGPRILRVETAAIAIAAWAAMGATSPARP